MDESTIQPDSPQTKPLQPNLVEGLPPSGVVPPVKRGFPMWGIALIAVILGIGGLMTWQSLRVGVPTTLEVLPTPTQTPTPTPVRQLSPLASQSAFLALEADVASLSSQIRSFIPEDPSLSPPILDLPLGL